MKDERRKKNIVCSIKFTWQQGAFIFARFKLVGHSHCVFLICTVQFSLSIQSIGQNAGRKKMTIARQIESG